MTTPTFTNSLDSQLVPVVVAGGLLYLDGDWLGNVTEFFYSPKWQTKKYHTFAGGIGRVKNVAIITEECTGSFTVDYLTSANISAYLASPTVEYHTLFFEGIAQPGRDAISCFFASVFVQANGDHSFLDEDFQSLKFLFESVAGPNSPMPSAGTYIPPTT